MDFIQFIFGSCIFKLLHLIWIEIQRNIPLFICLQAHSFISFNSELGFIFWACQVDGGLVLAEHTEFDLQSLGQSTVEQMISSGVCLCDVEAICLGGGLKDDGLSDWE